MESDDDTVPQVILLAEDEALVRVLANEILTDAGYDVVEACDGDEALKILELPNSVKVLFTDIRMPNLDGLSLAKIVRERWPGIGIVITSANIVPEIGSIFVPKPYDIDGILSAIKQAAVGSQAPVVRHTPSAG